MGKFELSLGSFTLKVGRDSATVDKSPSTALPYVYDAGKYLQYSSMMEDLFFGVGKGSHVARAIKECPQVGAILLNKCNAYINGKMTIVNEKDDSKATSLYGKRMQSVIDRPNILQNGKQFWAGVKFFVQAYGYCVVLRNKNEVRGEVSDMWAFNPEFTTVEFIEDIPYYKTEFTELIKSVKVKLPKGSEITIPKEDVYIFTDTTPLRRDSYLPSSRIEGVQNAVDNLIKGYKTEGRIISKPLVAFSRKDSTMNSAPIKEEDKSAMRAMFSEKYGTEFASQSDVLFLSAAVDVQQLMYPIAQLQIFEGRSANTAIVCDGLGYPFDLMGKDKGSTFNNGENADTVLYQNHIIPEAGQIDQQIIECMMLAENGHKIITSYDHVPALQGDLKEKAEVRKINTEAAINEFENHGCTYNEYLVSIGRPESKQPFKDLYYWEILLKYPDFKLNNSKSNGSNNQNSNSGGAQGNQGQENQSNQGQ